MKRIFFVLVLCMLESTLVEFVHAQGVPSAISILPTQTTASDQVESNRYEKRTTTKQPRRVLEVTEKPEVPKQQVPSNPEVVRPLEQATSLSNMAPVQKEDDSRISSVGDNVRDIIVGGSSDDVDRYRSYLSPDDIRRNRVELELAPAFIYNESKSDYYYRNYNTATPGGRLGLNVWFTPFFGVATSYEKTFLGTMKKDVSGASQTPYMDQWLQIGLRFRRFAGYSPTSTSITFGIDYHDYQRKVPLDDLRHSKLSTAGLLLSAETRVPASESVAWILGLEYMPVANHQELQTAGNIKSGSKIETIKMGISFGPEFKLNRTNRLFLKIRDVYEKNSFTGASNTADPYTGEMPENVSVMNNFLFFEVGYIWGN